MYTLSLIASVLLLVGNVFAGDICAGTTRSCSGPWTMCCSNIPERTCCNWPNPYGWAVQFQNMPKTTLWVGTGYGPSCKSAAGGVGDISGKICMVVFDGPSYLNWRSANWVADHTSPSVVAREEPECVFPDVIGFTTEDGVQHRVRVPQGKFEEVNEFVKEEDYGELLKLERVSD